MASSRRCVSARDGSASDPNWTRFLPPAQPAVLEHADDEAGAQAEAVERNSRDQLLGALTEIPRTAAAGPARHGIRAQGAGSGCRSPDRVTQDEQGNWRVVA